jgi:hypothetical protein
MTIWYVFLSELGAVAVEKRGDAKAINVADLLASNGFVDHGLYVVTWYEGGLDISYVDPCPQLAGVTWLSPAAFNALTVQPVEGLVVAS